MTENGNPFEIDIRKLLLTYLKKWWLFVVSIALAGSLAYCYTYHYMTPLYQASTTVYVNNRLAGITVDSVSSGELSTAQQLISTYIAFMKSDRILSSVAEKLDGKYSVGALRGMISTSQVSNTEIFAIYVTSTDPTEAAEVANAMAAVVPDEIALLVEGSSAWIIDEAKVPTTSFSPDYHKNVSVGMAAGAVFAVAVATLIYFLDVRIKDEEELNNLFDLPILGRIPEFSKEGKGHHYGYGTPYEEKKSDVQKQIDEIKGAK